ncbi:MAG: putative motility protein [Phycisphaerae bacterium]|nr:putative motility protein [Phycisphaerae bacterium]
MSTISNNSTALINSQLQNMAIMSQISTALVGKANDAAEMTGDSIVAMLDDVLQIAKASTEGLGGNIDINA